MASVASAPQKDFLCGGNLHFSSYGRPLAVVHQPFQMRDVENTWGGHDAISGADAVLEIQYPYTGCE